MAKKKQEISAEMRELLNEIESDPELSGSLDTLSEEEALVLQADAMRRSELENIERLEPEKKKKGTRANAGKYITFSLAGEDYGLYILNVKEIIGMMSITRVPRTPEFVRGVINLRGKVHPVIDLRMRFGLDQKADDARTPIIIVEVNNANDQLSYIGIVVDSVSEVVNVEPGDIEDTPAFGVDLETDFILGLAKINKKVVTLLDIDKILTSRQLVALQQVES